MNILLCIIISLCFLQLTLCKEDYKFHFVDQTSNRTELSIVSEKSDKYLIFKSVPNLVEKAVVQTIYLQQINQTGWAFLNIRSNSDFDDEVQAYLSGVSEALVSHDVISAHFFNNFEGMCNDPGAICDKIEEYLRKNLESMVIKSRRKGGFWKMIRLMLWQIKGLQDGYDGNWIRNSSQITDDYLMTLKSQVMKLYILSVQSDLSALQAILKAKDSQIQDPFKHVLGDGSCSAFIKYINGDLYMSHVTWNGYESMLRIIKQYDFPYRMHYKTRPHQRIPSNSIGFSSYPGSIISIDDFYVTNGGLVTIETTIGNYNESRWRKLKTKADKVIFEFLRVMAANRLATNGPDWIKYFSIMNSGTYNNQWMIVNNNLMDGHKNGDKLLDGLLYVTEQIPGLIKSEDVTKFLRNSYWASYNIPYNKQIYKESGFEELAKKYGDFFTYDKGPRALIFKRDGPKVNDSLSFMKLMRYNDYKNDPLAKCACKPPYSAENGISARCDLNPRNGTYPFGSLGFRMHGGTDMKMTTSKMASVNLFIGISGPTFDQQPVFEWKNYGNITRHTMHPPSFTFPPYLVPSIRFN